MIKTQETRVTLLEELLQTARKLKQLHRLYQRIVLQRFNDSVFRNSKETRMSRAEMKALRRQRDDLEGHTKEQSDAADDQTLQSERTDSVKKSTRMIDSFRTDENTSEEKYKLRDQNRTRGESLQSVRQTNHLHEYPSTGPIRRDVVSVLSTSCQIWVKDDNEKKLNPGDANAPRSNVSDRGNAVSIYPDFFLISTEQVTLSPSIHHSSNMRFATSLIEKVRSLE